MATLVSGPGMLALLVGLALTGNLMWIFARHSALAVWLLLGAQTWAVAVRGQLPSADLGIRLYPVDILAFCALCVGLARLRRPGTLRRTGLVPLLLLLGLAACATLTGIAEFGLRAAGNDSRTSFWYFLSSALYIATLPVAAAPGRVVRRALPAAAAVFAVLCLAGWAALGLHPITTRLSVDGVTADARPVPAGAALAMAAAALLLLRRYGAQPLSPVDGPPPAERLRAVRVAAAVVLLAMVVVLQHRTVWVAVVVTAFVCWAALPGRTGGRTTVVVAGAVTTALTVLALSVGPLSAVGDTLAASALETQDAHSTLTWRVIGWQDLLDAPRSVVQWLIGDPFGAGYDRWIRGALVEVSPHDYYVQVLLRLGAAGLLALLALYGATLVRLARGDRDSRTLFLLLVGQLVFFVGYSPSPEQGILLGLCLWQVRAARQAVDSGSSPARAPAVERAPAMAAPR